MIQRDVLVRIVEAGVQAPSADNSQPWRLKCEDNSIELLVDPTRTGLFFDSDMAATEMSCGAVIENMVLEALRNRLETAITLAPRTDSSRLVAKLTFVECQTNADALADSIASRVTHRGLYHNQVLVTVKEKALMERAVDAVSGCQVRWCVSEESRRLLTQAAFGADLIRFTHPRIHRDFHEQLRFGPDADASSDGLADDTLGIEHVLLPFLRLLAPWPVAKALNYLGLHYFMAWRGCWLPMQTAPALGVLICKPEIDYVQAGRAFERLWLAATAAKLDFQPLGALPLLLIRLHRLGAVGLEDRHILRLRQLDPLWRKACRVDDSPETLLMIFRVGHAKRPAARARRRPLADFLTPAGEL